MSDNNNNYSDCPPQFTTRPEHQAVLKELIQREPLFHRPEFGRNREDFETITDADFWEVGASGRRYSREYVISGVVKRYEDPTVRRCKLITRGCLEDRRFLLSRDCIREFRWESDISNVFINAVITACSNYCIN